MQIVDLGKICVGLEVHTVISSSLILFFPCRHALNVQIFLKMHRSDYAERQLRVMQQIDEDHTLTQLAHAWLNLAVVCSLYFHCSEGRNILEVVHTTLVPYVVSFFCNFLFDQGGSKIQEAYLIFQDFSEKYPMTS